jgi:hypothetical protein
MVLSQKLPALTSAIQPRFDFFLGKFLRDIGDHRLVLAVVPQNDIKDFGFGDFCVHPEAILYGKHASETNQLRRLRISTSSPIGHRDIEPKRPAPRP